MLPYLLRRVWQMVPTLAGVILLVFFLFKAFGGDPATIIAGLGANPKQVEAIRHTMGLDRPVWEQLWIFVREIVTLDWGSSWATKEPIGHLFLTRLPATLTVMIPILVLETVVSIPLGLAVAVVRGTLTDRAVMAVTTVALSISFLVYVLVGQWLFGYQLAWFPVQGWSDSTLVNLARYAPLPILLAILVSVAPTTRLYRSFFLDELGHDYVRTARARGASERRVLFKHVMRNALVPILTNIAVELPGVVVGSFLLEVFFSIPGLGREILLAVDRSDYPVIQAMTVYLAVLTMVINLLTDVLYRMVDPRVRLD